MTFQEWLNKQCKIRADKTDMALVDRIKFDRLRFNNGNSLSVQASEFHFCEPAKTLDNGEYESVEVYVSNDDNIEGLTWYMNLDTRVCQYIPIEIMEDICNNNGGILEEEETNNE